MGLEDGVHGACPCKPTVRVVKVRNDALWLAEAVVEKRRSTGAGPGAVRDGRVLFALGVSVTSRT